MTSFEQSDILLVSINARYSHAALGVRCLLANMKNLHSRTALEEFVIQDDPRRIVERILDRQPRIVGFSLAIWNISVATRTMNLLKLLAPGITVVLGGPEVRWAGNLPENADYLIRGEAEMAFPELCKTLLAGEESTRVIDGGLPDLDSLEFPFDEYCDEDLKQRIISVETSRGCPFSCEFCLSSREDKVRNFNLNRVLEEFEVLLNRGCRGFKFIDRTFNLDLKTCRRLLDFFYERWPRDESGELVSPKQSRQVAQGSERGESLFLHFEVVPDRFNEDLIESLARFPAGGIQLEMGVQTLNPEVGARISRKIDVRETAANLKMLTERTGAHVHADLIMGLPGEDLNGFASSFDALREMGPHEIQVGVLKLLPGAPIARHTREFGMIYNPDSPYDVMQTGCISFPQMQQLKRLARYYDMFANSGKFEGAVNRIMDSEDSAFRAFLAFSGWLWGHTGQEHAIAQARQYGLLMTYLTEKLLLEEQEAGLLLLADYLRIGQERYIPEQLRRYHQA